jgi:tRNA (guanine6-N2)-methyltransferase
MPEIWDVECDVVPGLEAFLARELRRCFRDRVGRLADSGRASLRFDFQGSPADLLTLRTAQAAYLALRFAGRRPTALLGHRNLSELMERIGAIRALHPPGTFASFRFGAAGRESSTFRRLAAELEVQTGLRHDPDDGELLIRVRLSGDGWEALLRISPRPLATRSWRVANYPGALNATIAAVMVELTQPRPEDHFINLLCGSGTLLVERLTRCQTAEAVGVDDSREALDAASANLGAASMARRARLLQSDATLTGLDMARYTALCADLPYGNLVGSHRENTELYPALLLEAGRLAAPGGRFAVITHELRLFDACLTDALETWQPERTFRLFQSGQRPQVYLLRRLDNGRRPRVRHGQGRPRRASPGDPPP